MNIHDFAEGRKLNLRQIMDFTSDVNPIGPSSSAKHAIRKGAKDLVFPPDVKLRSLRKYLCRREQIGEENILFGEGLLHILSALIQAVRPASVALVPPVSKGYGEFLARRNGEIVAPAPSIGESFSPDVDRLIESVQRADMMILVNPHDVTGATLPFEDLVHLVEALDGLGKTIVIDESYIEFTDCVSSLQGVVASRSAMIVRSFDLFHSLAGLPIAYGVGPAELVAEVGSLIALPHISSLASMAANASLKDKGYKLRTLRFIKEEKTFIIHGLRQQKGLEVIDTPCNFLLVKFNRAMPNLQSHLQKRAILTEEYDDGKGVYLKFPIKSHKFNARFVKALKSAIEQ
jgi:histidinol-phosphate/aromatic aminotransferase/cobyric acid decarboxylase-like protein